MGHSAQKLHELLPDEWLKAKAAYFKTAKQALCLIDGIDIAD